MCVCVCMALSYLYLVNYIINGVSWAFFPFHAICRWRLDKYTILQNEEDIYLTHCPARPTYRDYDGIYIYIWYVFVFIYFFLFSPYFFFNKFSLSFLIVTSETPIYKCLRTYIYVNLYIYTLQYDWWTTGRVAH